MQSARHQKSSTSRQRETSKARALQVMQELMQIQDDVNFTVSALNRESSPRLLTSRNESSSRRLDTLNSLNQSSNIINKSQSQFKSSFSKPKTSDKQTAIFPTKQINLKINRFDSMSPENSGAETLLLLSQQGNLPPEYQIDLT